MPDTTWGALTDDNAGQRVTIHFEWDDAPTTATFVRTFGSYGPGLDNTEQVRHVLDFGGDLGEQEVQLSTGFPVTVAVARTRSGS
jgi:hypothetical protein